MPPKSYINPFKRKLEETQKSSTGMSKATVFPQSTQQSTSSTSWPQSTISSLFTTKPQTKVTPSVNNVYWPQSKLSDNSFSSLLKSGAFAKKQPTAFEQYQNSINKIAEGQKSRSAANLADTEKYYGNLYDTTNKSLLGQIPEAQQGFENYKAGQQARVAKAQAALPGQEETVNTDFGAAQKVRAQTRNESEARLKNQFAGMNATDSYGAGSLTSELSGLENTFNAETASADVKRLDQIFKLRQDVKDVEDEADSLVATEELNLKATIRAIQSQVGLNNIEKQNLIQQAYQASQDKVDEIDAYIAQLQYQQTNTTPTTTANEARDTISLIDEVLGSDNLKGVTGISIANRIPGTASFTLQQKINQIKDKLALAARGQLKGQGQISDMETRMLQNAVSALNSGMNEADFRAELNKIKSILGRDNNIADDSLSQDQLSYILSNL